MSDDNTFYTVGEVAQRFALTVRTLHHWEAQGLLAPVERSWSNYRLYSPEDCARVQRIVIYRATGMGLMDIKALLESGESGASHLRRQRESLVAQRQQTDKMIEAIDLLLEDAMNGNALTVEEIGEILGDADFVAHQARAEERYGGTDDWKEWHRRTSRRASPSGWRPRSSTSRVTEAWTRTTPNGNKWPSPRCLSAGPAGRPAPPGKASAGPALRAAGDGDGERNRPVGVTRGIRGSLSPSCQSPGRSATILFCRNPA